MSEDELNAPRYVIRSGKRYIAGVHKLTDNLSDAITDTQNACRIFVHHFSPEASEEPFMVERLVVERNGFATGSEPEEPYAAPLLSRRDLTRWGGTRHNSALAECAEVEERRSEIISVHMDALSRSQMSKPFVDDYHASLAAPKGLEPDWHLSLFATRIFYAGVLSGRKEGGRRDDRGELVLDAPGLGLRHDSALAECAEREEGTSAIDAFSDHMTMLTSSPMFKLLVDSYHADLAKSEPLESDWYLAQFAARLFYAGVIAGRRENGQRAVTGHLIMDDPCSYEPKGAVINPA
ncbi:hypothetical protein HDF16_002167 [Granulicella aggregans]|uniref:Uncharacterized protein n=2 Tax=Granulicella aggregans TaxID=474949 RepID=A0A7W7ZDQ6_9BACT|nr:hypothetical protein [Granulicella aggregans]